MTGLGAAAARTGAAPLAVVALTKRYGGRTAVDDVSFCVRPGSVTAFLGPNGAGKTTTLKMVLGLVAPDAGQALVFDRPYARLEHPAGTVGAVLDADQFHPGRTGRNHLRVLAAVSGVTDARVDQVLALVDLLPAADKRVGAYSLGMRQRLGIAAAVLGRPRLLVLDEPANGLDPAGIRWLRGFLRDFAADGRAVLLSSHQIGEVARVADHVLIVDSGVLVGSGSPAQLVERTGPTVRVRSDDPRRLAAALAGEGVGSVAGPDAVTAYGDPDRIVPVIRRAGLRVFDVQAGPSDLEDVFLQLTGRKDAGHA